MPLMQAARNSIAPDIARELRFDVYGIIDSNVHPRA